jgi:glycosyltransferase involved in cell wall biosynthesis
MINVNDVCLIVHPYTARKDTGAGHDRYAYELIRGLRSQGVHCSVFDSGDQNTIAGAMRAEVGAIFRLAKMKNQKGIFHATATVNAQAPITARRRPLVTTIHDVLWFFVKSNYDSKLKCFLKSRAIKRAAERSDHLIVPFLSTKDFLVDELKIPSSRISIVPYGIDHEQFFPLKPGESLPKPSFMPKDGKIVLFVGSLTLGKGVDTLIQAFPTVLKAVPDARLVIGSAGWDKGEIEKLWQDSTARDRISLSGFIPENELRAAYIHADVTCFPSRYGFGLPTLESMACGTITVSGRTLDAPEFIGDAGLMTEPSNVSELADNLITALSNDDLRTKMQAKGIERAKICNWNATAAKTAEVYQKLS